MPPQPQTELGSLASVLADFDPLVAEWFATRFSIATEPQLLGWPEIRAGRDVLISAPTGSGKTLAAFLICLDRLVRAARAGRLANETEVVYVSPLKALSNDIHKNLDAPLAEISELAARQGIALDTIRTSLRTGDTPAYERQQMGKHRPHILVTTPESLYILLTAERSRAMLRTTNTVIVDEIHAVADDKRGSHLALSLARLDALVAEFGRKPQRIGLSATVKPIEQVAEFLSTASTAVRGHAGPASDTGSATSDARRVPSEAQIIDIGHRREMELAVEVPLDELGPVASTEMWGEIYDRVAQLILAQRTTLVFVNTRRLAERVAHALAERLGENVVLPHHGSLSRTLRLNAEARLKSGELRAVVATASLELGIDIGTVDLVCQIGSPRSIAVALQRTGRSGHWIGAIPKGRFFATTRDELIECAALVRSIRCGQLDRLEIPKAPRDILAQQIVAEAAARDWREDDLFNLVRSTYPYRDLPRSEFDAIITMLSDGISTQRGRSGAYLHRDQVNGRVRGRRGARLAAITSGGAIPETANYAVIAQPEEKVIGTLDEDFAVESLAGDVFLLGTNSWRIKRVEPGRVRVEDAHGAPPSVPFWNGEAPGRTLELSQAVSEVREQIYRDPDNALSFLTQECGLDEAGAKQALVYVRAGAAMLNALPTQKTIVAERFFDEGGGMQLILHAPFGSRINRAWGLALRKRFCRSFNFELQAAATDNGINISLTEQHAFPLELVFEFLKPQTVEHVLTQALLDAPMFTARWRWNASRALAILRFRGGRKVPPPIQRMRSEDLLASVFPDQVACAENLTGEIRIPDHPLVNETIENCLHEAMDLDGLKRILEGLESGAIRKIAIDNAEPSPLCHEILNANPYAYLDDAPLEERRARAVQLRRTLRADVAGGAGILDPAAIEQVAAESWPDVRNVDELHDALLTLIRVPPADTWLPFFDELVSTGRAQQSGRFWVATERLHLKDDPLAIVRGWMDSIGPTTASHLSSTLDLPVEEALFRLESEGQVMRGQFIRDSALNSQFPGETQWCNRRILARIHRLTLGRLRREIEPVTAAQFQRYLLRWQHLLPGTQLHGVDGALQIIKQLQGYEISAAAWEPDILARRIVRYEPEFLDRLCLAGEVMWARLSPHPAFEDSEPRRVRPTRTAPIAIFLRESADWLEGMLQQPTLSHAAGEVLAQLQQRGASFFNDLVRATGRLASEVEDGLWELVAAGLVTADGFENLRSLVDPKRRRGEGRGRHARPRHAAGRWALVHHAQALATSDARAVAFADQLLLRWGVIFRDLLARETLAPPWRDLLPVLRRKEAQGEIRGGRFVSGFSGEQFARPEALDLLRAVRRSEPSEDENVLIPNSDPLNLAGIILPGPRISTLLRTPLPTSTSVDPHRLPTPSGSTSAPA